MRKIDGNGISAKQASSSEAETMKTDGEAEASSHTGLAESNCGAKAQ